MIRVAPIRASAQRLSRPWPRSIAVPPSAPNGVAGSDPNVAFGVVAASDWPRHGSAGLRAVDAILREANGGLLDIEDRLLGQRPVAAVDREIVVEVAVVQGYLGLSAAGPLPRQCCRCPVRSSDGWDAHLAAVERRKEAGAGTRNGRAGRYGQRQRRQHGDPRNDGQCRRRSQNRTDSFMAGDLLVVVVPPDTRCRPVGSSRQKADPILRRESGTWPRIGRNSRHSRRRCGSSHLTGNRLAEVRVQHGGWFPWEGAAPALHPDRHGDRIDPVTTIQSGVPGHDNGTASVRLRLGKLITKEVRTTSLGYDNRGTVRDHLPRLR